MMSQGFDQSQSFDAFAMDDVDADAPGSRGGGGKLPEGGYKFMVTEVTVQDEKGRTVIECEVLEAKDAALIGRKHWERLYWPSAENNETRNRICKEQLLAWCYACKTTSAEEIKARQQANLCFNSAWLEAMVGRQCLGFVKHGSYQGADGSDQTSAKCEGRVWALDNPKGKGIPGWIAPAAGSGGQSAAAPATQVPPIEQSASPAADPFGGLV
jgi:hypothetical protein